MRLAPESRLSRQVDLEAEPTEQQAHEDDLAEREQRRAPVTLQAVSRPRPLLEAVAKKPSHYRTASTPTQYTLEEIQRHSKDTGFALELSKAFDTHGCSIINANDRLSFAMLKLDSQLLPAFCRTTEFAVALISDKSLRPQDRMMLATKCAERALLTHNRDDLRAVATQMKKAFPEEYQDFLQKVNDGASRNWVKLVSWFSSIGNVALASRLPPFAAPLLFALVFPIGVAVGLVVVPPGLLVFAMAVGLDKLIRTNSRMAKWAKGFESRFSDPQKTTKLLDELNAGKLA